MGILKFQPDDVKYEAVIERLPGGVLTLAKDSLGRKAWGARVNQGEVEFFPSRGTAKKALKTLQEKKTPETANEEMVKHIGDLPRKFFLVTDSQEVAAVRLHVGPAAEDYDGFLLLQEEGEYLEVWGFEGIAPWNHKKAWRIV